MLQAVKSARPQWTQSCWGIQGQAEVALYRAGQVVWRPGRGAGARSHQTGARDKKRAAPISDKRPQFQSWPWGSSRHPTARSSSSASSISPFLLHPAPQTHHFSSSQVFGFLLPEQQKMNNLSRSSLQPWYDCDVQSSWDYAILSRVCLIGQFARPVNSHRCSQSVSSIAGYVLACDCTEFIDWKSWLGLKSECSWSMALALPAAAVAVTFVFLPGSCDPQRLVAHFRWVNLLIVYWLLGLCFSLLFSGHFSVGSFLKICGKMFKILCNFIIFYSFLL